MELHYHPRVRPFIRKRLRLESPAYTGERLYFVTLCTFRRHPRFRSVEQIRLLVELLRSTAVRERFAVHSYCVMPDHLHLLLQGLNEASSLVRFVKRLKEDSTHALRSDRGEFMWQRSFYDHVLRTPREMHGVAIYIWMNPVRKRLCTSPVDYSGSGSFTLDLAKVIGTGNVWTPPWKRKGL